MKFILKSKHYIDADSSLVTDLGYKLTVKADKTAITNVISHSLRCTMYQRKIDVDMLNAVKSVLAVVSSISPSSEKRRRANARNVSQHTLYGVHHIHINFMLIHCTFTATPTQTKTSSHKD